MAVCGPPPTSISSKFPTRGRGNVWEPTQGTNVGASRYHSDASYLTHPGPPSVLARPCADVRWSKNQPLNATSNKSELNSVEFSQVPHEDPIRLKASRSQLLNPGAIIGRRSTRVHPPRPLQRQKCCVSRDGSSGKTLTGRITKESERLNLLLPDK